LVELAGGQYPEGQLPLDGHSLLPYLYGDRLERPGKVVFDYAHRGWIPSDDVPYTLDGLYREYDPVQKDTLDWAHQILSVRQGDYKLVLNPPGGGAQALFDLRLDPREQQDLAAAHPLIAAELRQLLERWFAEVLDEAHAFQMPVFQIGSLGYDAYPVLGKAPQRISPGLRNTVTGLKYWPADGGFAEYGLFVAEAGPYRLEAKYDPGDCSGLSVLTAAVGSQQITAQLEEEGQITLGTLPLAAGRQRLRIEVHRIGGEASCERLLGSFKTVLFSKTQ
jgi:hypothetical protein